MIIDFLCTKRHVYLWYLDYDIRTSRPCLSRKKLHSRPTKSIHVCSRLFVSSTICVYTTIVTGFPMHKTCQSHTLSRLMCVFYYLTTTRLRQHATNWSYLHGYLRVLHKYVHNKTLSARICDTQDSAQTNSRAHICGQNHPMQWIHMLCTVITQP